MVYKVRGGGQCGPSHPSTFISVLFHFHSRRYEIMVVGWRRWFQVISTDVPTPSADAPKRHHAPRTNRIGVISSSPHRLRCLRIHVAGSASRGLYHRQPPTALETTFVWKLLGLRRPARSIATAFKTPLNRCSFTYHYLCSRTCF